MQYHPKLLIIGTSGMKKAIGLCFSLLYLIFNSCYVFAATKSPALSKQGMVVSEQHLASQVGIDILHSGGNAIDAAVAVGYALAVVHPCCGNIGGGGFMLLHLASGKNIFINFRERAPLAAKAAMFLDEKGQVIPNKSTVGYLAVAVPGSVLGLDTALKKYGTMTRQQIMAPAIHLAENGFILTPGDVKILEKNTKSFRRSPNVAAIFLKNNQSYQTGDRLIQKDLANTLKLISANGPDVFYKGRIAESIVNASQKNGGILSLKDFSEYHIEELAPIHCTYRGYSIFSAAPPSSGGTTLCEMLNILEGYPLSHLGYHSFASVHDTIEAMRYAFFDRNSELGDPDFVENPIQHLISKDYAAQIRQHIHSDQMTPSSQLQAVKSHEGVNTTHYSIVDQWGNAASVTYTLNSYFGAKVIAGNTGFFLNSEMDDFTSKLGVANKFGLIQGASNAIFAGKRPLSSMTPTIIIQDNQVLMVLGSPGGPRIITATLQVILNVIDYKMNIQQAVDSPRFHHQWLPDETNLEPQVFSGNTMKKLKAMGYHLVTGQPWGAVEAIQIDPVTKNIDGANDMRRPAGSAIGY